MTAYSVRVGDRVHMVNVRTEYGGPEAVRARTVAAMERDGFTVDDRLWPATAAECTQCLAGCHNSPK